MSAAVRIWDHIPASVDRPKVSVIIPALNEARNLPYVAGRMPSDVDEVVFVDGNSSDNTVEVARELWPGAIHLKQTRKGKGNALACGFAAATGDIVVMIDADGSTDPTEIPHFVGALVAGADFAKGSRFIQGGGSVDITTIRRAGNKGLNGLVNVLFGTRYSDLCYGYNAFWRHCLDHMRLPEVAAADAQWGDGFEVETLINVRVAANSLQIAEVCSYESHRIHGVSNLNAISDGLRVLKTILHEYWDHRSARRKAPAPKNVFEFFVVSGGGDGSEGLTRLHSVAAPPTRITDIMAAIPEDDHSWMDERVNGQSLC
jgi:glycosyltransferase involved in cell wall biosynthesis